MTAVGLALGSGGARGLAHVGVLSVLQEEGIPICCIAGTSMGAIVGALFAETLDAAEIERRIWAFRDDEEFHGLWKPFVEDDEVTEHLNRVQEMFRVIQRKMRTIKAFTSVAQRRAEELIRPLERLFEARTFANLQLPFAAVAIDLVTGRRKIFSEGELIPALYASSAIPGIFPPLEVEGHRYIDGGVAFRVPVSVCRTGGSELVIAVDIPSFCRGDEEYDSAVEVMMRSDMIARDILNRMVLQKADVVIVPQVSDYHWADFRAADRIRDAGAEAARQALPRIRELLRERNSLGYRFRKRLRRLLEAECEVTAAEGEWVLPEDLNVV
jgi:NTE family protein